MLGYKICLKFIKIKSNKVLENIPKLLGGSDTVPRGKFITVNAYNEKISNQQPKFTLNGLEKE